MERGWRAEDHKRLDVRKLQSLDIGEDAGQERDRTKNCAASALKVINNKASHIPA